MKLLFIGNSFTSRSDLPRMLAELASQCDRPLAVETRMIVAGGASLRRHWNAGAARAAIESNSWDYVVLQEQSTLPLKNVPRYHDNVRIFDPVIRASGAKIALYLTWSRANALDKQDALTAAVESIAREIGARVVPVGRAWHDALRRDASIQLYADDGSHPTPTGTYLAACVFLITLLDREPSGFAVSDRLKLSRETAVVLQEVASKLR
ncbi:MAG TPA: hypothetical protein VNG69_06705 [Casimicrobiaceae bacterium]|nr:hypothetical protein [Casimicrobiaceae bacterium]